MADIRGFFSAKKRPAPPLDSSATPASKKLLAARVYPGTATTGTMPDTLIVKEVMIVEATQEDPEMVADPQPKIAESDVPALTEAQERRIALNCAAAEARRRRGEDPVGLVEHLALVDDTWRSALASAVREPYFRQLMAFLRRDYAAATVFPPAREVLGALQLCPLASVRVVILGQDPYHGPKQAHGLAFSVNKGMALPPSLRNMYKELREDLGVTMPTHGCLEGWARQGVLLLNTCLTVRKASANSHAKKGWEHFTDAIIRKVAEKREGVIFLLWGKPAQKKGGIVSARRHKVLKSSHPSPLSAARATKDCGAFLGSKCFSRVNEILRDRGEPEIDWTAL